MPAKIIIVDDDRDTRETLRAILETRGYSVALATSGLKLIAHLKVDRPDMILLDVMMSWIDGFDLCRALKRNPEFTGIPIVFISGRGDPDDVREGLRCGAAGYFVKPIDTDDLLRRIAELLPGDGAPPHLG